MSYRYSNPERRNEAASQLGPDAVAVPVACRVLGIGRTKLYQLLSDGSLPSVTIGRRRLVRLDTARKLLATLEKPGLDREAV